MTGINPSQAQILGKDPQTSNPLILLANAIAEQTGVLSQIAANTAPQAQHLYAYEEVEPNHWLGYCLACSESAKRFVMPCLDPQKAPASTPPASFLTEPVTPSADRLNGA